MILLSVDEIVSVYTRLVKRCLNLEFIELNLSLDYEIVINRVVNFGLRKIGKLESVRTPRRSSHKV